jgi:hypothetical protein
LRRGIKHGGFGGDVAPLEMVPRNRPCWKEHMSVSLSPQSAPEAARIDNLSVLKLAQIQRERLTQWEEETEIPSRPGIDIDAAAAPYMGDNAWKTQPGAVARARMSADAGREGLDWATWRTRGRERRWLGDGG